MVTCRAIGDVPRELVAYLAGLLAAERRARGTRPGSRALSCWWQAIFALVWFRERRPVSLVGAGLGISPATAYRYLAEAIDVWAAQAPDLHQALNQVNEQGWYVVLDGTVISCDRLAEKTTSTKGKTIDAWSSGKTGGVGGNVHAVMRPAGRPVWVSAGTPGSAHDLTAARTHLLGALSWRPPSCACPPWPTVATTAPASACSPRSRPPLAAARWTPTPPPVTCSYAAYAASANAASPC